MAKNGRSIMTRQVRGLEGSMFVMQGCQSNAEPSRIRFYYHVQMNRWLANYFCEPYLNRFFVLF